MAEVAHVDDCSRIFRVRLVRTRPVLVPKSRGRRTSRTETSYVGSSGMVAAGALITMITMMVRVSVLGALITSSPVQDRKLKLW